MAVESPVLYNDWWVYLRDTMGSTHLNPSPKQIYNAYKIRSALQLQGYGPKAIAGVIGNAQVESGLSTGAIEKYWILPNQGEVLADVPNSYMLQYYVKPQRVQGYGLGILQWDRYSAMYQGHDLLNWCNANGYQWYDGNGQMARLAFEFEHRDQYGFWHLEYGEMLTWEVYKDIEHSVYSSYSAGECANVWRSCWEVGGDDTIQERKDNGNFWYQYFIDHPNPPINIPPWLLFQFNRKKVLKNGRRKF